MSNENQRLRSLTDEELMELYKLGENEAFEELYRRYAPKIYGFLVRKLSQDGHVDDVFQETFLRLHRFRMKYDSSLPFIPWFFTVARNALIDSQRKLKARIENEIEMEEEFEQQTSEFAAATAPAEALPMQAFLDGLSEREKEVLILNLEQGLSFKDIGSWLSITSANARQLSSRALRKLKAMWK